MGIAGSSECRRPLLAFWCFVGRGGRKFMAQSGPYSSFGLGGFRQQLQQQQQKQKQKHVPKKMMKVKTPSKTPAPSLRHLSSIVLQPPLTRFHAWLRGLV